MAFLDIMAMSQKHSFSKSFLRELIRQEGCPHYRRGRKIWFDEDEFNSWFAEKFKSDSKNRNQQSLTIDEIISQALDGI